MAAEARRLTGAARVPGMPRMKFRVWAVVATMVPGQPSAEAQLVAQVAPSAMNS